MVVKLKETPELIKTVAEKTGLSEDFIVKISAEYDICANDKKDPIERIIGAMNSERYKKYKNDATRQSIVKCALCKTANSDSDGDPFDEMVMVFGGTDRKGKVKKVLNKDTGKEEDKESNPPMYFIGLKKNRELIRIQTWDSGLFPVLPCKARIVGNVITTAEWGDSIKPSSDEGVSAIEAVDKDTVQKALMRVAMDNAKCGSVSDDLVRFHVPYVIRGKIQYVNPIPKWNENSERDGAYDIIYDDYGTPTKKGVYCSISLDKGDTGVGMSIVLDKVKTKHPVIDIEDFEMMANDAYESSKDPVSQGHYLRNLISCRDVIGVGTMSRLSTRGGGMYVDFACVYVMEVNPDIKPANEAPKIDEFHNDGPDVIDPVDTSLSPEQKIVASIVEFGLINNQDPAYIPSDKARSIAEIGAEYDDNMVHEFKKAAALAWKTKKAA